MENVIEVKYTISCRDVTILKTEKLIKLKVIHKMNIKELNCKWRGSLIWNVSFTGVFKKTLKYVLKSMEKFERKIIQFK